ncbi:MAG: adenine nucleotide alpha hydrolase [SAR324 cluster bacterium]|nr:adenine nucleotide alpha hydrolase [SAR324 cluster bacterium]
MAVKQKIVVAWSGGKDSAMALWRLQGDERYQVAGLLTTLTEGYDRIQMHGVRRVLLEAQAESLGLRLIEVWVPMHAGNDAYEAAMKRALGDLREQGVSAVVFGDLFLEDIRAYREKMMAGSGLAPMFPLWREDTRLLSGAFLSAGFRATVICIDPSALPPGFVGLPYDRAFIDDLPEGADPCGENGEFHTFVHDGPNFRYPLRTMLGVKVERSGFHFADLLPIATGHAPSGDSVAPAPANNKILE